MSKQTITPGPWRHRPTNRSRTAYVVEGPANFRYGFVSEADARAIAALPELLGAAKGVLAGAGLPRGPLPQRLDRLQAVVDRMEGNT